MLKPQNNQHRMVIPLDGVWEYTGNGAVQLEKGFIPEGMIAVPASWNEQHNNLYHYKGRLWYQKRFEIPCLQKGKRLLLRFSGLLYQADFFLNGKRIGRNAQGIMPCEFDITDGLNSGENLLVAGVDGDIGPGQAFGRGDFYEYGGIHRPVTLELVDEIRFIDLKVQSGADGKLNIRWKNSGGDRVVFSICGKHAESDAAAGEIDLQVEKFELWSPEHPNLYELKAELFQKESRCDSYTLKTGFRSFRVEGRNLILNGEKIKLIGFAKHEDFHIIGKGMNHALNIRDFDLMKWCGANSLRTSHYPYSEEFLALADEIGFLVIDEAPFDNFDKPHFADAKIQRMAIETVTRLIDRDYNHPSVISWSMGNECKSEFPESAVFFEPIYEAARAADPSRPLTYVAFTPPGMDHLYQFADIIGINRYYGWYGYRQWNFPARPGDLPKGIQILNDILDQFSNLWNKPMILSEFGADCISGHHSMFNLQFTEEFQAEMLRDYILCLQKREDVAGMHVWNFADFSTNQDPLRVQGNRKGIFTRSREPKAAAFVVRRLWTGKGGFGLRGIGDFESQRGEQINQ